MSHRPRELVELRYSPVLCNLYGYLTCRPSQNLQNYVQKNKTEFLQNLQNGRTKIWPSNQIKWLPSAMLKINFSVVSPAVLCCCEHVTLTRLFFFERRRREGYDAGFVLKRQTNFTTRGAVNCSILVSRDQFKHAHTIQTLSTSGPNELPLKSLLYLYTSEMRWYICHQWGVSNCINTGLDPK